VLRLPHEVRTLFRDWLHLHYPLKASHVMARVQDMRGGRDYDADFNQRMKGQGPFSDLISKRFASACRRLGLASGERFVLDTSLFRVPTSKGQLDLF